MSAALALIGIVLGASPATAGPGATVRIDFEAPSGCSDAQTFTDALAERSQSLRLAKTGEPATLLRVRLTRSGSQVRGELSVVDAEGATDTRRVEGTSCDEVVRGLSLTASLALDRMLPAHTDSQSTPDTHGSGSSATADAASSKPNAEQSADASKPAAPKAEPPPAKPDVREGSSAKVRAPSAHHEPLRIELGAQGALAQLVLPKWNAGGGPALHLGRGEWGPSLGLRLLYLSNDALASSPDLVVHWVGAALSVCPARFALVGPLWLEPCGLVTGGRLSVSDRAALRGRSVARSWWSAGGLVRSGLPLAGHLNAYLEAGFSVPLLERRFILDNPEQSVGRSPLVSLLFGLGASYGF